MNKPLFLITALLLFNRINYSQTPAASDSLLQNGNLHDCIIYALSHQPSVRQSLIDEKIANAEIRSKLSDWYPQLSFNFNLQHNYQLPTSIIQGNPIKVGLINTSGADFSLTQTIFNRDVLLSASTAQEVREQARQQITNNNINVVANVSKAFYAVLLTQDQIELVNEDVSRLKLSQHDTYSQYQSGVVDKTDYMRATIALNNAEAELRQDNESLKTSIAFLKDQMGYPPSAELKLEYDSTQMENDINIDTTLSVNYENRIEYKLLQTQKSLQKSNLDYYVWSFLPSISAFGDYNINFMNDNFSKLYNQSFPNSYIGLELSFPIFEGTKRIQEIDQASLELKRVDYDIESLRNSISTECTQAMANYKSNLNNLNVQKNNLQLAKEVYNTIQLQYKSGIKTYLDVITAETDLRTTQVNYINALYQTLSSKLDVEKALGIIKYQ